MQYAFNSDIIIHHVPFVKQKIVKNQKKFADLTADCRIGEEFQRTRQATYQMTTKISKNGTYAISAAAAMDKAVTPIYCKRYTRPARIIVVKTAFVICVPIMLAKKKV